MPDVVAGESDVSEGFQSVDIDRAMQLSFDALNDLVSMHEAAQAFKVNRAGGHEKARALNEKIGPQTIPAGATFGALQDLHAKARPFACMLLAIVRLFLSRDEGKRCRTSTNCEISLRRR